MALLALALQGCGGGKNDVGQAGPPAAAASQQQQVAAPSANGAAAAQGTAPKPAKTKQATGSASATATATSAVSAQSTFVPAAKPGRRPAVLLVTGGGATATAEAQQLAKLGAGVMVVGGSASPAGLRGALASLRGNAQVDPNRIGVVAEGPAATVAAKLVAATPQLGAVVLADPTATVEQPVKRFSSIPVLFQRGEDSATMTDALSKRLVIAAPAGSMVDTYPKLDTKAVRERDRWVVSSLG